MPDNSPQRKRRTREHVIEDMSENHLERFVLLNGHVLRRPSRDYGVDVTMFHFADDGTIENGEVRFQLKATNNLNLIRRGTEISIPIKTGDIHYWSFEIYPLILVVFDAKSETAYWLHIQEYATSHPDIIKSGQETINVHISISDQLTAQSVAEFRNKSLLIVNSLRNSRMSSDDNRKPK